MLSSKNFGALIRANTYREPVSVLGEHMKVKLIRGTLVGGTSQPVGAVVDVLSRIAQDLIRRQRAIAFIEEKVADEDSAKNDASSNSAETTAPFLTRTADTRGSV